MNNETKYGLYELHDEKGREVSNLIDKSDDQAALYKKRDELQDKSLAAGLNMHQRRYGVRIV